MQVERLHSLAETNCAARTTWIRMNRIVTETAGRMILSPDRGRELKIASGASTNGAIVNVVQGTMAAARVAAAPANKEIIFS